jgi:hypothetical protein
MYKVSRWTYKKYGKVLPDKDKDDCHILVVSETKEVIAGVTFNRKGAKFTFCLPSSESLEVHTALLSLGDEYHKIEELVC